MDIYDESGTEKFLSNQIQKVARYEISRRQYDEKILAEKLNILPIGAKNLLEQKEWPIRTAIQVADALGLGLSLRAWIL
jgi:hypothetical protein